MPRWPSHRGHAWDDEPYESRRRYACRAAPRGDRRGHSGRVELARRVGLAGADPRAREGCRARRGGVVDDAPARPRRAATRRNAGVRHASRPMHRCGRSADRRSATTDRRRQRAASRREADHRRQPGRDRQRSSAVRPRSGDHRRPRHRPAIDAGVGTGVLRARLSRSDWIDLHGDDLEACRQPNSPAAIDGSEGSTDGLSRLPRHRQWCCAPTSSPRPTASSC